MKMIFKNCIKLLYIYCIHFQSAFKKLLCNTKRSRDYIIGIFEWHFQVNCMTETHYKQVCMHVYRESVLTMLFSKPIRSTCISCSGSTTDRTLCLWGSRGSTATKWFGLHCVSGVAFPCIFVHITQAAGLRFASPSKGKNVLFRYFLTVCPPYKGYIERIGRPKNWQGQLFAMLP